MARMLLAGLLLAVFVVSAESQVTLKLTMKMESFKTKGGAVTSVRLISERANITDDFAISAKTKLTFHDGTSEKKMTPKTLLTDEAAKEHFKEGSQVVASLVPGGGIQSLTFGPGALKKKPAPK